MKSKSESAADVFRSGFNCAQAVFAAYAAGFGIPESDGLRGCDLRTDEGKKYFKEHDLHETVCVKCVRDAVSIAEQMLLDDSR
jgi:hypothetical protein